MQRVYFKNVLRSLNKDGNENRNFLSHPKSRSYYFIFYNIIENGKLCLLLYTIQVHIGWISKKIPSLQLLCRLKIHKTLQEQTQVDLLPIPCRLKNLISSLFTHSIKARHCLFIAENKSTASSSLCDDKLFSTSSNETSMSELR